MTCPFCAEEIRDAAVVCRFCGATREGADWRPPSATPRTPARSRGMTLLRGAGVLLILSAVLEAVGLADPVVILGADRTGVPAIAYHVVLALVQAVAGAGLLAMRPWGYRAVMVAVGVFTVDRLAFLLDGVSVQAWVALRLGDLDGMDLVSAGDLDGPVRLANWVLLAGWWVLAATVFASRRQFRSPVAGGRDVRAG